MARPQINAGQRPALPGIQRGHMQCRGRFAREKFRFADRLPRSALKPLGCFHAERGQELYNYFNSDIIIRT